MKKSLVMASLLALGTSAMAIDVQPFVGVNSGASWTKVKENGKISGPIVNYSVGSSDTESSFTFGLKGGIILDNSHRLGINYNPSFDSYATVHNILASYDYLIPLNDSNRFYVGAHAGFSSFRGKDKLKDNYYGALGDINASGFAYGAQTGYIYDITKNIEFEFGLSYTKYNVDKTYSGSALGHNAELKLEMKDSISTLVGINYKF